MKTDTKSDPISIHALLAESDSTRSQPGKPKRLFLSTLSLRRATLAMWTERPHSKDFYPRSPCGERRACSRSRPRTAHISIHALLAESDQGAINWQRTASISIHALLAESDENNSQKATLELEFLSTLSLRRATLAISWTRSAAGYFYPRSPCGERHRGLSRYCQRHNISIHALLAESDATTCCICSRSIFLSTLSLRRATAAGCREWKY